MGSHVAGGRQPLPTIATAASRSQSLAVSLDALGCFVFFSSVKITQGRQRTDCREASDSLLGHGPMAGFGRCGQPTERPSKDT